MTDGRDLHIFITLVAAVGFIWRYFSTLDLVSGYWQVPLDQDAREKSAFVTRGGLWQWKVLLFGLTSAQIGRAHV